MVGVLMNFSDIYEIKVFNWKLVKLLIFTYSTNEKIHIKWVCVTKQPMIHNFNQETQETIFSINIWQKMIYSQIHQIP